MKEHNGNNAAQQEKKRPSTQQTATVVSASMAKASRAKILREALQAMGSLWRAGVEPNAAPDCMKFYTLARVERAYLDGDLGKLDIERIALISKLFGANETAVEFVWMLAVDEIHTQHDKMHAAAMQLLAAGEAAIVAHKPLFAMIDASRAFNKTAERDKALFAPKIIRPSRIDPKTGGWAKTARIRTGMPNLPNIHTGVRGVQEGPGTDRFTTAERKVLAQELGVMIDTLRRRERELDPDKFDAWAAKLRKGKETKAKKAAEKIARGNRRRRLPGKEAAILKWIAWTEHCIDRRYSVRQAYRILQGQTIRQILNQLPSRELVLIRGSDGGIAAPDVSDKDRAHPGFSASNDSETLRDSDDSYCHRVSNNVSDKDPSHPAFCRTSLPDHIEAAVHETVADLIHTRH